MSGEVVYLVDDDEAVRDSVALLLGSVGLEVHAYPDAAAFLAAVGPDASGCALLDVRMPGQSGLSLFQEMRRRGLTLPVLFITGHGDVPMAVEAMRDGAFDFIEKPYREELLLDRVRQALEQDGEDRVHAHERQRIRDALASLTPREREVLDRVADGQANKVIALELDISPRTVELHRARGMEKLGARSLAHLVRMLVLLRERPDSS